MSIRMVVLIMFAVLLKKVFIVFSSLMVSAFNNTNHYCDIQSVQRVSCKEATDTLVAEEEIITDKISDKKFDNINFFLSVEEELQKMGTTVEEELSRSIKNLRNNSANLDDKDSAKFDDLAVTNEMLLSRIEHFKSNEYEGVLENSEVPPIITVVAAIAWFVANGYDLSMELLSHAASNPNEFSTYEPVYGGRVFSSPLVINAILGTTPTDRLLFESNATTIERDLYYSLHGCNYRKDSFNVVEISDIYDFGTDGFSGFLLQIIEAMIAAHEEGTISYYNVRITADYTKFIPITVQNKSGSTWIVNIKNTSSMSRVIVYNAKMASLGDARNWTNLVDIKAVNIPANSARTIYISENGTATHFALCYCSGVHRYITYANEISTYSEIGVEYIQNNYVVFNNNGFQNLGKNGNSWLIEVDNYSEVTKTLQYNSSMCFESDAINWTNLTNIVSHTLVSGTSYFFYVSENVFATHIALRLLTDTDEKRVWINGLNIDGGMVVNSQTYPYYNYLPIQNMGKSGINWVIKITNPTISSVTVYYNSKMCNFSDAKNWTNLSNIKSITLSAGSYRTVLISENWFATSITTSYISSNGIKLISYANNLNSNGSMSVGNNHI